MPDYDKVIEGLKHCKQGAKGCTNCPYRNPYDACQWILMQDALDLLEYQQIHLDAFIKELEKPYVLTLDEALGSDDPVYFESCGKMECWVDAYISDDLKCAVFYRFRASEFMLPLSRYEKDWRCWNKPPTDDQKKAVIWK